MLHPGVAGQNAGRLVRVGMAVRACFREVAAGVTLPYFEPAD